MKTMCADVVGILDAVGVEKVLGFGHDWGYFPLSRLANYFPERFVKFVFFDMGYQAPTAPFDLDVINDMSKKQLRYTIFGYWYFFNDEDAAELMDRNVSMRPFSPIIPEFICCPPHEPDVPWPCIGQICQLIMTSEEKVQAHEEIFDPKKGGYLAPLNWYKVQSANLNTEDESSIAPDRQVIQQPTLLVTCIFDSVAIPTFQEGGMRLVVKNLKVEQVDTGHLAPVENSAEGNNILQTFFEAEHGSPRSAFPRNVLSICLSSLTRTAPT